MQYILEFFCVLGFVSGFLLTFFGAKRSLFSFVCLVKERFDDYLYLKFSKLNENSRDDLSKLNEKYSNLILSFNEFERRFSENETKNRTSRVELFNDLSNLKYCLEVHLDKINQRFLVSDEKNCSFDKQLDDISKYAELETKIRNRILQKVSDLESACDLFKDRLAGRERIAQFILDRLSVLEKGGKDSLFEEASHVPFTCK